LFPSLKIGASQNIYTPILERRVDVNVCPACWLQLYRRRKSHGVYALMIFGFIKAEGEYKAFPGDYNKAASVQPPGRLCFCACKQTELAVYCSREMRGSRFLDSSGVSLVLLLATIFIQDYLLT
jgi:hypothetical protein